MENQEQDVTRNRSVVTTGDWIVTMLIMLVPLINIIMLLVWAFGSTTAESKANWAKASLIFMLIGLFFLIIFGSAIIAALASTLF